MVHRAAVAEVFLTDAARVGEDRFLVAAQWPRDHALYHPDQDGLSDPLLFAETIRQALVYLAHSFYGVPLTHRFVGSRLDFRITDTAPLVVGPAPLPVTLEAEWVWVGNRPPNRFGMELRTTLVIGGRRCGEGRLQVVAVDDKRYGLLRGRDTSRVASCVAPAAAFSRVPPALVGRQRHKDTVLAPGAHDRQWQLCVDLTHAVLFDHPGDHVPLMVLLEGFRQLGHLSSHDASQRPRKLVALSVDCLAFAELDAPIHLTLDESGPVIGDAPTSLGIQALQEGRPLARCETSWAVMSGRPVHLEERVPA